MLVPGSHSDNGSMEFPDDDVETGSGRFLGCTAFVDGQTRPVYENTHGQYVHDNDGELIYGLWFIPRDEGADTPLIVHGPDDEHGIR